jgi:two-component system, response regulator PdtaR
MNQTEKRQIMVLDDDQIQHILFRKRAQQVASDFQLHFFEMGESLLEFLLENEADTVVSDLNMEAMDGWIFIEELFKLGFKGKLFILSASVNEEDRIRAKKDSRIHGFFEKPLSNSDLIQILTA